MLMHWKDEFSSRFILARDFTLDLASNENGDSNSASIEWILARLPNAFASNEIESQLENYAVELPAQHIT